MTTRCERRGQLEIGIIDHDGRSYAAFGASVYGHNVTSYTRQQNGHISLTRWDGGTMLACRSEIVREHLDGSIALINNKSTASGGETPKGSAVSGVYPIPRELLDTRTTWFG